MDPASDSSIHDELLALGDLLKQDPPPPPLPPPSIPEGATFYDAAALALAHRDSAAERFLEGLPDPDPDAVSFSRRCAIERANSVQRYWVRATAAIALRRAGFSASGVDDRWADVVSCLAMAPVTVTAAAEECRLWAERHNAGCWTSLAAAGRVAITPAFGATPAFLRFCWTCRRPFYTDSARRGTCNHCQRRAERNRKRVQRQTDLSERLCLACNQPFAPRRSDARCCSAKCRARLSRQTSP